MTARIERSRRSQAGSSPTRCRLLKASLSRSIQQLRRSRSAAALAMIGLAFAPLSERGTLALASRQAPALAAPVDLASGEATTAPFTCSTPTIFLAQSSPTQLYDSLYGAGKTTFTKIGSPHGWSYNAVGYDPTNKYLYAVSVPGSSRHSAGHLLKIDKAAGVRDLTSIRGDSYITSHGVITGAFDGKGNYWVTAPTSTTVDEIKVTASPPKVIKKVKLSPAKGFEPADFSLDAGFMWGMQGSGKTARIYRLNLSTGSVTSYAAPKPIGGTVFGAAWTYGNGNLGFLENATGQAFQIVVANPASSHPRFSLLSTYNGPRTHTNNDAAACIPTPVDLGVGISTTSTANYGAPLTWTFKVTNHGPGISSGYAVKDTLPEGVSHISTTSPGCSVSRRVFACSEGKLTVGASARYKVSGHAPLTGSSCITNAVSLTGNEKDPKPSNNRATSKTCLSQPANACTIKWSGPSTGGLWSVASSWNLHRLPMPSDVVCIGTSAAPLSGPVTFDGSHGTGKTAIRQLKAYAELDVTAGELYMTGAKTDTKSAVRTVGDQSFVHSLTMSGGQLGDSTAESSGLTDDGTFTWSGGNFETPASQNPRPVFIEAPGFSADFTSSGVVDHWNLMLESPTTLESLRYLNHGATIKASAEFTFEDGGDLESSAGRGQFTVTKTGSVGGTDGDGYIGVPTTLTGRVNITSGRLDIVGGGTIHDFTLTADSTLNIQSPCGTNTTIVAGSTNSGPGTLELDGCATGKVTVDVPVHVGTIQEQNGITKLSEGFHVDNLEVTGGELDPTGSHTNTVTASFLLESGILGDAHDKKIGDITDAGGFESFGGSFVAPSGETPPTFTQTATSSNADFGDVNILNHWAMTLHSPLNIQGTTNFVNGASVTESAPVTIEPGSSLSQSTGAPGTFTVTNTGSVTMGTAGTTAASVGVAFDDKGPLNLGTGTLDLQTNHASSIGGLTVSIGGPDASSFGVLAVSGGAALTISGTLTATVINGFMPSSGTFDVVTDSKPFSGTYSNTTTNGLDITYPGRDRVELAVPD